MKNDTIGVDVSTGRCHGKDGAFSLALRERMTTISFARRQFPPTIIRHTVCSTFVLPSAIAMGKICSPSAVWMSPTNRCDDGY